MIGWIKFEIWPGKDFEILHIFKGIIEFSSKLSTV